MSMARHDPLFYRPRPIWISLQQFFVVVGFDDKRVRFTQTFDQHFGRVSEIGDKTERAVAGAKEKADRIHRIVRNGKWLNTDVADRKLRSGSKNPPIAMLIQRAIRSHRFGGQSIGIN